MRPHAIDVEAPSHRVREALAGHVPKAARHLEQADRRPLALRHGCRGALLWLPRLKECSGTGRSPEAPTWRASPDRGPILRLIGSLVIEQHQGVGRERRSIDALGLATLQRVRLPMPTTARDLPLRRR